MVFSASLALICSLLLMRSTRFLRSAMMKIFSASGVSLKMWKPARPTMMQLSSAASSFSSLASVWYSCIGVTSRSTASGSLAAANWRWNWHTSSHQLCLRERMCSISSSLRLKCLISPSMAALLYTFTFSSAPSRSAISLPPEPASRFTRITNFLLYIYGLKFKVYGLKFKVYGLKFLRFEFGAPASRRHQ